MKRFISIILAGIAILTGSIILAQVIAGGKVSIGGAVTMAQGGSSITTGYCAPAGASATAYTCTPSPAVTALPGSTITFTPDVTTGAGFTVNANGLGAKTVKDAGGVQNCWTGCMVAGSSHLISFDGTNWRAMDIPANILVDVSTRGTMFLYTMGQESCARWTQTSAQIISGRTASTSAEDDFVTVPANAIIKSYTQFIETTAFAGLSGGFSASMQVHGGTSAPNLLPTCTLEGSSGHACQEYPGNPSATASFTASIYYLSSNGSTTFNSLSAGTGVATVCASQGQ